MKSIIFLLIHLFTSVFASISPVVIIPGTAGSRLEAKLDKPTTKHWYCQKKSDWYTLWLDIPSLLPPAVNCWVDNIKLLYNTTTKSYTDNIGVSTRTPNSHGSTDAIEYLDPTLKISGSNYFHDLVEALVKAGGVRNATIRGSPYDFRRAPTSAYNGTWLLKMTHLIESTSANNNDQKVVLLSHSMGCLYTLWFLNQKTTSWKNQYIKRWIATSGVFGGAGTGVVQLVSGSSQGIPGVSGLTVRDEQRSYESSFILLPTLQVFDQYPLVQIKGTAYSKNYSAHEYDALFTVMKSNFPDALERFQLVANLTANLISPGVKVTHYYGIDIDTPTSFEYNVKNEQDVVNALNKGPTTIISGDGDGTVPLLSLQSIEKKKFGWNDLDVKSYAHQTHTGILKNTEYIQDVVKLVTMEEETTLINKESLSSIFTSSGSSGSTMEEATTTSGFSGSSGSSSQYSVVAAAATNLPVGLETKIGKVTKHLSNPLFQQDQKWEKRIDNGYPNIIQTPTSFECFYGDCVNDCGKQILLYANSTDGISWKKPILNLYDVGQVRPDLKAIGKKNNIILYGGGIGIYRDEHETNSSQRYKAFGPGCYGKGGNTTCTKGGTATSPDGLTWMNKHDVNWPSPHRYDTHTNAFWNARESRYVVTTRDGFSQNPGRTIAIATSESNKYIFDIKKAPMMVEKGNKKYQLYSQITFEWMDNAYLGLVSVFDAEHPSTFGSGKVHCRLSISTDLKNWRWIDAGGVTGTDFIELGNQSPINMFDSHICFAAASPIKMKDGSARIYYMGGNGPHNGARNSSLALATLNSWDQFASVSGSGNVTLMKLKVTGKTLLVTMDIDVEKNNGGYLQIGYLGSDVLLPELCNKITKNVVHEAVKYVNGAADYENFIGQEISLTLLMVNVSVYTVGFV